MAEMYQQIHRSRLFFKNIVLTKGSNALQFTVHQKKTTKKNVANANFSKCKILTLVHMTNGHFAVD